MADLDKNPVNIFLLLEKAEEEWAMAAESDTSKSRPAVGSEKVGHQRMPQRSVAAFMIVQFR